MIEIGRRENRPCQRLHPSLEGGVTWSSLSLDGWFWHQDEGLVFEFMI